MKRRDRGSDTVLGNVPRRKDRNRKTEKKLVGYD